MTTTLSEISLCFEEITLRALEQMSPDMLNELPFGVIGLAPDGLAEVYNATEARSAGLSPAAVIGVPFFEAVGQCLNNFMVAQRFEDEPALDVVVPYVLTLRMRPTRVRLRLLARPGGARRYILVER